MKPLHKRTLLWRLRSQLARFKRKYRVYLSGKR